jgi:hypothetical protein
MPEATLISTKDPKMKECIDECIACGNSCLDTMSHCLRMGGDHAEPMHITLLANCAEMCRTSADFMLTGSEFSKEACRLCASICEKCATSCGEFGDDEQMAACEGMCLACAESCREMAGM